MLAGLRDGKQRFGTRSGLIISALRHADPKWSLRLAELAVAYKNKGVVGYDLAGAEDGFQARKHAAAFHLIRSNNVNCTAHAGEAFGPESIHQALHDCGAHRIGHGTRLREDGDVGDGQLQRAAALLLRDEAFLFWRGERGGWRGRARRGRQIDAFG